MSQRPACVLVVLVLTALTGSGAQADLVSEWPLDAEAKDAKGANHGALVGAPQATSDRYGDPGRALAFDGKDDCVGCGSGAGLSFGDGKKDRPFSIAAWVKMDSHDGFAIVKKPDEYYFDNNRHFRFCLQDRSGKARIGRSGGLLERYEGTWVHLAATYDGSGSADGITMYVNGEARKSRNETQGEYVAMENQGGAFTIGRAWRHARGAIDDVRIYDHALSAPEVKALADYFRGAAALALPGAGAAAWRVTIPRTGVAPVIDGRLSDDAWRGARWHDGFRVMGAPEKAADPKTSFAAVHDGDHLYIAVRADEPEPGKIKASAVKRDASTWMDDSIEVFLDSTGDARGHYHFAVNTKGVLYDAQVVRGGGVHNRGWASGARAAAKVDDGRWVVEIGIPFSALSFGADAPETWRLNVTRSRFVTGRRELSTYAAVRGSFHDTGDFAVAQVADADLIPFLRYRLSDPRVKILLRKGRLVADISLDVANVSAHSGNADLRATLSADGRMGEVVLPQIALAPGTRPHRLTMPIPAMGEATLTVALREPPSRRIVCSRETPLVLAYEPLKVEVRRPHYQNAIFAGQTLEDIALEVEATLDAGERQDYAFEFVLESDRELMRHTEKIEAEKAVMSFPLPNLPTGRYRMQGRLVHQPSGKVLGQWRDGLRKLPPRLGEVRFDEQGVCLVDNRPFVPFGLASDWWPKGIWDAIALGCNAIECCSINLADGEMPYVDELDRAGLKLLVYAYPKGFPIPISRRGGPKGPLTAEQAQALRSHVRQRKHHPAILAWYTGNEPYPENVPPATMKQIDDIIRDEDPYHPTVIINHNITHIAGNVDAMALVMPDPYPGFLAAGPWARPNFPTQAVQEAVRASRGRKPVWAMLQAHDGTLFGSKGRRAPTFADLRNQLYQAAAAGAKGFFWYCRYWIEPHVEIGLAYLAKEVAVLREAILAPASTQQFAAVGVEERPVTIHLSRRQVGAHAYLFAVSSSDKARDVDFRIAAFADGPLYVVAEARAVQVQRGAFTDSFTPYATHVYTTDRRVAEQLSMAPVLKQIEESAHPPVKPGNLAGKDRGAKVEVREKGAAKRCPAPGYMIDGSPWSSWRRGRVPESVDILFAQPKKVSRVVVDSNISHLEIQVPRENAWTTVAEVTSTRADVRREIQTVRFPAVETDRLRVLAREVKAGKIVQDAIVQIWEIEVYAD